jgi:hypothetical protein
MIGGRPNLMICEHSDVDDGVCGVCSPVHGTPPRSTAICRRALSCCKHRTASSVGRDPLGRQAIPGRDPVFRKPGRRPATACWAPQPRRGGSGRPIITTAHRGQLEPPGSGHIFDPQAASAPLMLASRPSLLSKGQFADTIIAIAPEAAALGRENERHNPSLDRSHRNI